MDSMTEFFGEPISVYTDEQAIADGVLVVVDQDRFPGCLFTQGVHAAIEDAVARGNRNYKQIALPLMMDVVLISRRHPEESLYTGDDLEGNCTGKTLWFGMNGLGGITVMFPEER